ncbi:peptidylprolyl isomerase A [Gammaproteobacteria bacterium ESL0073]|nr:peptidylprolyl isomerase A [Gammaproteobacteria bacterium ESL0073]
MCCFTLLSTSTWANQVNAKSENPHVLLSTNVGDIELELYPQKAPVSVENFLNYVNSGFYNNTIFHRVISNFMIQGGGFTEDMTQKPTQPSIKNEADNELRNDRGTIAMARTFDVNSATSQFFINVKNNDYLNHSQRDFGYAVFGKVVSGMDVVDKIADTRTTLRMGSSDVPVQSIIILSAKQL